MTKEDFLSELRSTLSGSVSADVINDNVNYYENFINTELRKGRELDEVLEELGSPRLIAKTIVDTAPAEERRTVESDPETAGENSGKDSFIMPWWMIIIVIFAVMIAIYVIFTVASALLPVLIVAAVILFVIKVLGKGR